MEPIYSRIGTVFIDTDGGVQPEHQIGDGGGEENAQDGAGKRDLTRQFSVA